MAKAINTNFDDAIENDLALELIDGAAPSVQKTLKNAENVYKSFLYLRKMYSMFPAKETITGMGTISGSDFTTIQIPENSNYIEVTNSGATQSVVSINSNEFILAQGSKERFPIVSEDLAASPSVTGDVVKVKGDSSYAVKNIQEF